MDLSVVMTIHDREPELLMASLRSLYVSGLGEAEIIVVDDRSRVPYAWLPTYLERFASWKLQPTGDYPGCRTSEGYGNPSRAFNTGLLASTRGTVVLMSSDVLCTTRTVKALSSVLDLALPWTPKVMDLDSGAEYCGPTRVFPMPWFLAAPREACLAVGGWDEEYLKGLCYEDNDFVGRLGLHCGTILCDWDVTVYHQSHFQPAYVQGDREIQEANARNRLWTMKKWNGVPFDHEKNPYDVRRRPHPSGCAAMEFVGEGLLKAAVEKTTGVVACKSSS